MEVEYGLSACADEQISKQKGRANVRKEDKATLYSVSICWVNASHQEAPGWELNMDSLPVRVEESWEAWG